jgi:hypothetical protein
VTVWRLDTFKCELWALSHSENQVQLRLFNMGFLEKVQDTTLEVYPAQAKAWKEEVLPSVLETLKLHTES